MGSALWKNPRKRRPLDSVMSDYVVCVSAIGTWLVRLRKWVRSQASIRRSLGSLCFRLLEMHASTSPPSLWYDVCPIHALPFGKSSITCCNGLLKIIYRRNGNWLPLSPAAKMTWCGLDETVNCNSFFQRPVVAVLLTRIVGICTFSLVVNASQKLIG